jgi:oxygen-dependent protoporphyrinogen oxidase
MSRIIIIGGGISGLAAATFLERSGLDVQVLEAADEPGGNVRSDRIGGRVLDRGATGWLNTEPAMDRLLERVGLTDSIVAAHDPHATRWIFAKNKLHAAPLTPRAFIRTGLIPWWAKLRVLLEPFVGRTKVDDETVADFVRRRLGQAFVDRLVGPMVAGIHAAKPGNLSLKAAFPSMAQMEKEHRSLFLAMRARAKAGSSGGPAGPGGHLHTLTGGVGTLTDSLASRLGGRLQCGVSVQAVRPERDGWTVHTADGALHADGVILACPASSAATIVRGIDAELATTLDAIPYAPVTVAISAWSAGSWDHSPEGFGVLVARGESVGVLGTMCTSNIFPDQSKDGEFLLRTMLGGSVDPISAQLTHQRLVERVTSSLSRFYGEQRAEPLMFQVYRHARGIPQYTLGHTKRVAAIRAAEKRHLGLFFAGNHLGGVGVKDSVATAEKAALNARSMLFALESTDPEIA